MVENLRYVGTRYAHALGQVRLGDAKLLHAQKNLAQECGANVIDGVQRGRSGSEKMGSSIRFRPVGYAAEHLIFWLFAAI